ncbi:arsenate reductase/protein-tyrosine-phosphatase family protein [Rhodalgimonas zhirmunskyi]|uniref:Helix-turn-helix domain-containing protein n=1 Tax=Rhodalgimonas zhirmunskyi TaxID=2964767 RepID=A0AAJ1U7Z1_9RHOB|nr:helix-turn-helix domain-containing protein [Rhodoalgimonas zhirmunskyi]MDQ2093375.1 helix-turn-helix domain-containing protein [Rhodoalgimonas zhirmunskyi]
MEQVIPNRLATLGHPQRLALYRLLMRRYPDRVPATELAQALGLKPNTLSSYISALMQAGLVTRERIGTSLRYGIDMEIARETFDYLLLDCCRGRPELCALHARPDPALPNPNLPKADLPTPDLPNANGAPPMTDRKYNVLFICTGNSARSIFAETLLRDEAGERFNAYSAGTNPHSELNPFALTVLHQKGHDISALSSKNLSVFQGDDAPKFDFVFTVCNQAANEECPAWSGQPISAHWGMPDPVKAEGTDAEKTLAFQQAYGALRNRIRAFTALPLDQLDKISLQRAIDDIARTNTGEQA